MTALDPALCAEGHIKLDAVTGSVAIRTSFSDVDYPELSWLIATIGSGAINRSHSYVNGWDDALAGPAPFVIDGGYPGSEYGEVISGGTP